LYFESSKALEESGLLFAIVERATTIEHYYPNNYRVCSERGKEEDERQSETNTISRIIMKIIRFLSVLYRI
jgi:hypothetical protein